MAAKPQQEHSSCSQIKSRLHYWYVLEYMVWIVSATCIPPCLAWCLDSWQLLLLYSPTQWVIVTAVLCELHLVPVELPCPSATTTTLRSQYFTVIDALPEQRNNTPNTSSAVCRPPKQFDSPQSAVPSWSLVLSCFLFFYYLLAIWNTNHISCLRSVLFTYESICSNAKFIKFMSYKLRKVSPVSAISSLVTKFKISR